MCFGSVVECVADGVGDRSVYSAAEGFIVWGRGSFFVRCFLNLYFVGQWCLSGGGNSVLGVRWWGRILQNLEKDGPPSFVFFVVSTYPPSPRQVLFLGGLVVVATV